MQAWTIPPARTCDTVEKGYRCRPEISHFWGILSPYFAVPTELSADVPKNCEITFVSVLARHAARYPFTNNSISLNSTIRKIQSTTKEFKGKYAFLADYDYRLGAESLTMFGEEESVNLGIQFFNRYTKLLKKYTPFLRAAGIPRIIETAQNFSQAIHKERIKKYGRDPAAYPYPILALSEAAGSNDTYVFRSAFSLTMSFFVCVHGFSAHANSLICSQARPYNLYRLFSQSTI